MSQPYDTNTHHEQYWDTYLLSCRAEGLHPSFKDFLVWVDENLPEGDYSED